MNIDIEGISKPEILVALFNAAKCNFFRRLYSGKMTLEEARELLHDKISLSFYKHRGRKLFINITDNRLYTDVYDRYNGEGAAYGALTDLLFKRDRGRFRRQPSELYSSRKEGERTRSQDEMYSNSAFASQGDSISSVRRSAPESLSPEFASGRGGDFAGGGSSGEWEPEPSTTYPTKASEQLMPAEPQIARLFQTLPSFRVNDSPTQHEAFAIATIDRQSESCSRNEYNGSSSYSGSSRMDDSGSSSSSYDSGSSSGDSGSSSSNSSSD